MDKKLKQAILYNLISIGIVAWVIISALLAINQHASIPGDQYFVVDYELVIVMVLSPLAGVIPQPGSKPAKHRDFWTWFTVLAACIGGVFLSNIFTAMKLQVSKGEILYFYLMIGLAEAGYYCKFYVDSYISFTTAKNRIAGGIAVIAFTACAVGSFMTDDIQNRMWWMAGTIGITAIFRAAVPVTSTKSPVSSGFAITMSAVLFGFAHIWVYGDQPFWMLGVGVSGFVMALGYHLTHDYTVPAVAHFLNNLAYDFTMMNATVVLGTPVIMAMTGIYITVNVGIVLVAIATIMATQRHDTAEAKPRNNRFAILAGVLIAGALVMVLYFIFNAGALELPCPATICP